MAHETKDTTETASDDAKRRVQRLVTWHVPKGEVPDGLLLVEVDLAGGDTDVALVYIDDEDCNTLKEPENGDVWTAWGWSDVSRYAHLDDILIAR